MASPQVQTTARPTLRGIALSIVARRAELGRVLRLCEEDAIEECSEGVRCSECGREGAPPLDPD